MAQKKNRQKEYRRPKRKRGNPVLVTIIVLLLVILAGFFVFSRVLGGRAEITDGGIQIILPDRQEQASATPPLILDEEPETPSVEPEPEELPLPDAFPKTLYFSSGVGAWSTSLTLERDGTFTGVYLDTDIGSYGEGYPNGTRYICGFSGRFEAIEQVDPYCFVMTLAELTSDYEEGKEWIEDGVRMVSSVPYGIEEGTEFHLYRPETPIAGLSEQLLEWRQIGGDPLGLFCLYNVTMGYAFFG